MAVDASVRIRAAKACKRCNQRRVKCDASIVGTPCSRCKASDIRDCVLIQSRRGTYARKKGRIEGPNDAAAQPDVALITVPESAAPPRNDASSQHGNEYPESRTEAQHGLRATDIVSPNLDHSTRTATLALSEAHETPATTTSSALSRIDGTSPGSGLTESSATSRTSYREISWAAMFDHFLDSRRRDQRKSLIDKCSITYLGESFPLAMVLEDFRENGEPRLHHPGPPLLEGNDRSELPSDRNHPSHMQPEDVAFLEAKEAFESPPPVILNALINSFMDRVYPLYPIVNRQEFMLQYKAKKIPWILLHALCFSSATFCPLAILHRAGFANRKQARFNYYRKAKALFDTGYECNKITILQSVILLTQWGGGPNNYWNFYSWIGTGVTIAEALGIHRSMAGTNMNPQDRSLLKRLWWILVIRDASCGTLVGRPFRINLSHSDTEMLTIDDFEYDMQDPEFIRHPLRNTFGLYQIQVSKLSLLLREIVASRFQPGRGRSTAQIALLDDGLQEWRKALPIELNWSDKGSANSNVFTSTLAMLFNHHLILVHLGRSDSLSNPSSSDTGSVVSGPHQYVPELAAQRISGLTSMIITKSNPLLMPHETFQAIFLAQVVFYTQCKSPQPLMAQLGRTALSSCQMAWHELKDAWDPSPWVQKLFDNLVANLNQDTPMDNEADLAMNSMNGVMDYSDSSFFDTVGVGYYDSWSTHPMLSTFFDASQDYMMQPNYFEDTEPVNMLS